MALGQPPLESAAMDLDAIFKAYDVRGLVPEQLDEEAAWRIGGAFAVFSRASDIVVGQDCRASSPSLAAALAEGIAAQGCDVRHLGMTTTDMVYFAAGALDVPGVMITASHNPKGYNGIKFCLAGAAPVGEDTGLAEIRSLAGDVPAEASQRGAITAGPILDRYLDHLLSIVSPADIGPLRVVVDGGNGVAGVAVPGLFAALPAALVGLYLDPDGEFPNHHPDPLRPENLVDLERVMGRERVDMGIAFDGDADRAFVIDDQGGALPGSTVTAIVADWYLRRAPGATVVYNLICSRSVPETVQASGGTAVRSRVGHSFIKLLMREHDAVFGGEHSGHYYFKDNYGADSGILAMLVLLQVVSEYRRPLSAIRKDYERYSQSGEINFSVDDTESVMRRVEEAFAAVTVDRLDGLTVDVGDAWFNLRPSNTEPALRLNVEARDATAVGDLVARVSALVEEEA